MEFDTVDISVAVAAPSGLVTPIVFNADNKRLRNWSRRSSIGW